MVFPTQIFALTRPWAVAISHCVAYCCVAWLSVAWLTPVRAADFAEARAKFFAGEYEECIAITRAEVDKGIWNDFWSRLLIQTLLTTGRYAEARDVYKSVETKFANSVPLRMLAAEAYRYCGEPEVGDKLLDDIPVLIQAAPWRFSDRENMLALGKFFLAEGEDAREVLDAFYDRSLKSDPKYVEAHVAIGELGIEKSDYQEAVKSLMKARELRPEDPYIHFLLAKAWAPSDSEKATEFLQAAIDLNPQHPESLLMQAENFVDSERYADAEKVIARVFEFNAHHPEAWALQAAIAHLTGNYAAEGECRSKALKHWQLNPNVDYLIGKKLSQHYRFAESVTYQRRALKLDPEFLPAKFQLAQDLLRVGKDDEGWSIVDQVNATDRYNVVAFNLKTLQNRIAKFTTIQAPGFIIRMDAREAKIYGDRVAELLQRAKATLTKKYELELTEPVTVEIFPQQSDFAIRTFGLPGGAGFLGVCFGKLITANSPASQGESPSNWESVLWHEFCHVITLQKTQNRMPRWLSEGISVYEELEQDSSWGQRLNPLYSKMLQGEDFVPLSQLSGAFLQPKSPLHLQFAYFESSLAVRFLVETQGLPLLNKLLLDLGVGVPIEDAFARLYGDVEALDASFEQYVKKFTDAFVPDTDFSQDDIPKRAGTAELQAILKDRPNSYYAQHMLVEQLMTEKKWSEAKVAAVRLIELYPEDAESGGALELQARVARELDDEATELTVLSRLAELSSDNVPGLLRLIQLHRKRKAWAELQQVANRLLAVQPLIATGHEAWIEAAKELGQPELAIPSLRSLQQLEPLDPAGLHYQLASALFAAKQFEDARREVLYALEETPRYREAQQLLLKIVGARQVPAVEPSQNEYQVTAPDMNESPPSPVRKEAKP